MELLTSVSSVFYNINEEKSSRTVIITYHQTLSGTEMSRDKLTGLCDRPVAILLIVMIVAGDTQMSRSLSVRSMCIPLPPGAEPWKSMEQGVIIYKEESL